MTVRYALFIISLAALSVGNPAQAVGSIKELSRLHDSDVRIATIAFRLSTRNQGNCPALGPASGLVLHSLGQYGQAFRAGAQTIWKFPSPVSIEAVVTDSPAAQAGLQAGDGLEAIQGRTFNSSAPPGVPATYLRDAAENHLQNLPVGAPIDLTVRRGDQLISVVLHPIPACRTRLEVVPGNSIKARSDGAIIQIGQEFAEQLSDDELAFALAHELAHTIRQHRWWLTQLEMDKSKAAQRRHSILARQFEDEADLLALQLLATAGWDPNIAPRFMRSKGRKFEPLMRGSKAHRSADDRARLMERAIENMGATKQ